jgi:hypothetical protein
VPTAEGSGRLAEFVDALDKARRSRRPSASRGEELRYASDDFVGSGLELAGELIQLGAFRSERPVGRATRIIQPPRRHH